jgi:hypothetical protein
VPQMPFSRPSQLLRRRFHRRRRMRRRTPSIAGDEDQWEPVAATSTASVRQAPDDVIGFAASDPPATHVVLQQQ